MSRKTLIFDFDGTIADTFKLVINIVNENPKDFGIDGIDASEIEQLRGLSISYLIREFGVHGFLIPLYLIKIRNRLKKKTEFIEIFDHIKELLLELEGKFNLAIISGNSPITIRKILIKNGINHMFTHVIGNTGAFTKDSVIAKFLKKEKLDKSSILYIGDEVRDVAAAKDAGIKVCAVSWGFNSEEALKKHNPDYLVNNVNLLREVISTNFR